MYHYVFVICSGCYRWGDINIIVIIVVVVVLVLVVVKRPRASHSAGARAD